jgi:two-component system, NarL family, response regulator NreC
MHTWKCITDRDNTATTGHHTNVEENAMITLLLVEDELLLRQGLRTWLDRALDVRVVGEASNGTEAMMLAQALHPRVVLVDLSSPPAEGITAIAALHRVVPESAVVLLSLHDDSAMRARAQAAGAFTFVGKQEGVKALLAAIHEAGGQEHML